MLPAPTGHDASVMLTNLARAAVGARQTRAVSGEVVRVDEDETEGDRKEGDALTMRSSKWMLCVFKLGCGMGAKLEFDDWVERHVERPDQWCDFVGFKPCALACNIDAPAWD